MKSATDKMQCVIKKKLYDDSASAITHLAWIRENSDAKKVPNGAYKCDKCSKWHLTSASNDPAPIKRKEILNKYLDIPFPEYLDDVDYASNSMLKKIERSPAHLLSYLNDEDARKPSNVLVMGRAAHAMVLEPDCFNKYYYEIPDDIKNLTKPQLKSLQSEEPTPLALELSAKWGELKEKAHGREFIKSANLVDVQAMRKALLEVPKIRDLLTTGTAEQTRYFVDVETGIKCKMRADFVHGSQQSVIVDYKTCDDARPKAFIRSIINYGYDFQGAHYKIGGAASHFFIVAQEKIPPYAAKLYLLDTEWMQRGEAMRRKCINTYAECLETGVFPAYEQPEATETLTVPNWARNGE